MATYLGCIADDFTGATDLAGILARGGVPVSLRIGVPSGPPEETAPFEVIALKIRNLPVAEAVAQARAALAWLQHAGAERVFWKYCSTFDSTPEGNIGPVAEALMDDLGTDQTIYCPAFPENGRSVFMGHLFVGRDPLAESPMRDHPLTPMRDSNLMRLLAPQVTRRVGLVDRMEVTRGAVADRLATLRDEGVAHVIVDAVADADLSTIAAACEDMALVTGGSALARPLSALYVKDGAVGAAGDGHDTPLLPPETIVLSGSCSSMTNAQVAAYLATGAAGYRLDPLALAEAGPGPVLDWLAQQDLAQAPLIYATARPEDVRKAQDRLGTARAGSLVEEALAACARAGREMGARNFIVAGGETSGAVTQALGVDRLTIGAEIAPGVPWTYGRTDGADIALALKSGNFGAESFFSDARTGLDGP
ncbi:3-oxo-tetronate kinase [Hasllibacter sp. MH4015]|uniref:3-oxo-tetronate kinase n=1 Tax=Hasllibacter sp. MH4015 TaxID=2854029 RepID=UPI001CD5B8E1|nr:3-oxo-tetronate kinase [Hasllibacter sp. MH4015]